MVDQPQTAADDFFSGALSRISRFMIGLAVLCSAAAWLRLGWRISLGFGCGCAIAYLNFHWLKRVVSVLGDRITEAGKPRAGDRSRAALPAPLLFDGLSRLCYIHCFSRQSVWAFCGPVFARSGYRMRSRLRGLRRPGARHLMGRAIRQSELRAVLCPNNSG